MFYLCVVWYYLIGTGSYFIVGCAIYELAPRISCNSLLTDPVRFSMSFTCVTYLIHLTFCPFGEFD